MSLSVLKADIQNYRKSLQKAITELNPVATLDILNAIDSLEDKLTPELIKESKLGNIINSAREKFSNANDANLMNNDIVTKSKEILLCWKRIMESNASVPTPTTTSASRVGESSSSSVNTSRTASELETSQSNSSATSSSITAESSTSLKLNISQSSKAKFSTKLWSLVGSSSEQLAPAREKIVSSFADIIIASSKNIEKALAYEIARQIEKHVNISYPFDLDAKAYSTKCRSLAFNIKRNQALCENIISKNLQLEKLMIMTPNELANSELLNTRNIVAEKGLDSKRGDWYEAHRLEILETNGLDPENQWSFDADNASDDEPEIAGD